MPETETDYLIVGAGASGMAFADALTAESDVEVVLVDRRHRPGGHWNDAYPFVRLHQPSAFYGVNSRTLGSDSIDTVGPNAGYYERASAAEILDYYDQVLDHDLLPTGKVRFLGMSDHHGEHDGAHEVTSRLTGVTTRVRVRRKVVDATYLETAVPSTHTPSFPIDHDTRLITPNALVDLPDAGSGFTVIGAGKTAMDSCTWLLDQGVEPGSIRWIRPRDAWLLDRAFLQPLALVTNLIEGLSVSVEAAAEAEHVEELFRRLEECGHLLRLDPDVEPTMYRGAVVSRTERESLRSIEHVVRMGRVRRLAPDRIVLDDGTIPTDTEQIHVDATAIGLRAAPARPIFEPGRITLQPIRTGNTTFNAALVGYLEAARDTDEDRNRLCPPNTYMDTAMDWIPTTYVSNLAQAAWAEEPDLVAWLEAARLNVARGVGDHRDDPRMQAALARMAEYRGPALTNLERLRDGVAAMTA